MRPRSSNSLHFSKLLLSTLFSLAVSSPVVAQPVSSLISSNFNGTAIPAGRTVWFNSVLDYSGPTSQPVTIFVRNATVSFTANSVNYVINVPDADITLGPSVSLATTNFNTSTGRWETTADFGSSGNTFMAGVAFPAIVNLPGGINPVVWSADFSSDTQGVCLNWKWAAAVYTTFSTDYSAIGVKPIDPNTGSPYLNSHHAGTPENFTNFVTGGARGGGGSNFTGSYSGTSSACPGFVVPVLPVTWSGLKSRSF
ncbi:MAG: hypothetical protein SGI90_12990 [Candidatus Eisenbacteria bacterium]|nr:hypothetical protein [Candidatus Eisenbacteria bacterium]